jgi:signal transduction histidine kinase
MLDFTSSAMLDTRILDLECVVSDTLDELESEFPPTIHITLESRPGPFLVRADPDRIAQALKNMALNARDAILAGEERDGAELRVSMRRIEVENEEEAPSPEVGVGEWVCLSVSDTGTGMTEEVCEHLFEPFFTTRDVGEGQGLGLPQAYGIVRQHEGVIDFESSLGEGTTFYIYLPAHEGEGSPDKLCSAPER